jgi:hypothetical protein
MLIVNPGTEIEIPIVYRSGISYVDPEDNITIIFKRGFNTAGPVISGPYVFSTLSFVNSPPGTTVELSDKTSLSRESDGSYIFKMTIPQNLFDGIYTVQIDATVQGLNVLKEINVQSLNGYQTYESSFDLGSKSIQIGNRSLYQNIGESTTHNILLIGHTDAIEPYGIIKLKSIQDAINILRGDSKSPLLRGIFDAYACGARDIYIMSCGYMSEYVEDVNERNFDIFLDGDATPNTYSFYDLYYIRLQECYKMLRDYEFLDIIVPLETSIINTGTNNFVEQLARHCEYMQTETGEVQFGIIGSRNNGISSEDIDLLAQKDFNLDAVVDSQGYVISDKGRHVILVYGEVIMSHKQIQVSYSSSVAACVAGMLSSTRIDRGLTKTKIPAAFSVYGVDLNAAQVKKLQDNGINTIVRGQRSRRAAMFDILLSSDFTQAISESYKDSSNVRLVSVLIREIQSLGNLAVGKFGYDKITSYVQEFLSALQSSRVIVDYKMDALADKYNKGTIYFNISITSARTLRQISFNVSTGKGA